MPNYKSQIPNHKQITISKEAKIIILLACFLAALIKADCLAMDQKVFGGSIDFINKNIDLSLDLKERGAIDIKADINQADAYNMTCSLRRFKLGEAEILTDFYTTGVIESLKDGKAKYFKGKAWTQHSLLNHKPIQELSLAYELYNDKVNIISLSWGNFIISGQVVFKPSSIVDLILVFDNIRVTDLAGLLGINDNNLSLEGIASGSFRIKGPLCAMQVSGRLIASSGRVSSIAFNSAKINLEGKWPVVNFVNSRINGSDGILYDLKGQCNLRELANFTCPDHKVMVYSANNAMRFQDWVIKRQTDYNGVDMVEAEYSLKKNQALKMRIKDEGEMFAWERTVKF